MKVHVKLFMLLQRTDGSGEEGEFGTLKKCISARIFPSRNATFVIKY